MDALLNDDTMASDAPGPTVSDRRTMLKRAGLLTSAAVAGTVGVSAATADAGAARRQVRAIDVACNVATFTVTPSLSEVPVVEGFPPLGTTFYVEGLIFPARTIPTGEVWDFDANVGRATGSWFCYGFFMHTAARPDPHLLSTQSYVFGSIRENNPFPRSQIQSHGLEGTNDPSKSSLRALIGGTGTYSGASGTVRQRETGTNTTVLPQFGLVGPNLRFDFRYN